jgi:TonB family protein
MSNILQGAESPLTIVDRRLSVRHTVPSLAYVDLGENNGGIILNLGEGGLAVTLVAPLQTDRPSRMRFQLPGSGDWLEASGEVARISESKKEAGMRFVNLSEDVRIRIKNWVSAESAGMPPEETASDLNEETVVAWPAEAANSRASEFTSPDPLGREQAPGPALVAGTDPRLRRAAALTGRHPLGEEQFASDNLDQSGDTAGDFDRRSSVRRPVPSLAYVDLGENNGGVVLNIGEGGMALTSAAPLYPGVPVQMRFQLPGSNEWLEAIGEIARISDSKKEAGLRFVNLSEEARGQIKNWISSDISAAGSQLDEAGPRERAWRRLEMPVIGATGSHSGKTANPRRVVQKNAQLLMSQPSPASTVANTRKWAAASAPTELGSTVWDGMGQDNRVQAEDGGKRVLLKWGPWVALAAVMFMGAFFAGWFTAGTASIKRSFAPVAKTGSDTRETAQATDSSTATFGAPVPDHVSSAPKDASRGTDTRGSSARVQSTQTHTAPTGSSSAQADVPSRHSETAQPPAPASIAPPAEQVSAPAPSSTTANQPAGAQVAGTTEQAAPPPAKPAEIPAVPKSSVSVSFGPYPSIRIPPGLKPQTSQKSLALQIGQLLSRVDPVYPEDAKTQQVEGSVKLHAVIGRDGAIESVETRSGPALLTPAAEGAIRQWRFTPSSIGGQAVEAEEDITVTFKLNGQ